MTVDDAPLSPRWRADPNPKVQELLEEFADEMGSDVGPATRGFLDKLRELFD